MSTPNSPGKKPSENEKNKDFEETPAQAVSKTL